VLPCNRLYVSVINWASRHCCLVSRRVTFQLSTNTNFLDLCLSFPVNQHNASLTATMVSTYSVLVIVFLLKPSMQAFQPIGCFAAPPEGLIDQGRFVYQSLGYCRQRCSALSLPVLGLTNGTNCLCGNSIPPPDTRVEDSACNLPCPGFVWNSCKLTHSMPGIAILITACIGGAEGFFSISAEEPVTETSATPTSTAQPETVHSEILQSETSKSETVKIDTKHENAQAAMSYSS
jgi:hypothetical protein